MYTCTRSDSTIIHDSMPHYNRFYHMNEFDPSMGQYRQTTPWNLRHIITG